MGVNWIWLDKCDSLKTYSESISFFLCCHNKKNQTSLDFIHKCESASKWKKKMFSKNDIIDIHKNHFATKSKKKNTSSSTEYFPTAPIQK